MTQSQLARMAGVTQSFVSAVERGARSPSLDAACVLAAAVGQELGLRLYPADGVSLRDSGQASMASTIVGAAHPTWHPYVEFPVGTTDRRAADLVLVGRDEVLHVEIERRIVDFQAQIRNATLKRDALSARFTQPVRLIVALPDRRSSREAIGELATLLSRTMPVRSSRIRRGITHGEPVSGDGILFWPVTATARRRTPGAENDVK